MKIFYKAVNLQVFKDSPQWGLDHPQGEQQSALDRVDQIKRYRVIKSLHDKVTASNAKPAKYFGKKFFTWADGTFDEVKRRAYTLGNVSENDITNTEPKCALIEFCEVLKQSLGEDDAEYGDLIWAIDFHKALQKRQADRAARVQEDLKDRQAELKEGLTNILKNTGDVNDRYVDSIDGPGANEQRVVELDAPAKE